jgi:hypothetical protein
MRKVKEVILYVGYIFEGVSVMIAYVSNPYVLLAIGVLVVLAIAYFMSQKK